MSYAGVHLYLADKLKKNGLNSEKYFFGNLLPDVEYLMKPRDELMPDEIHKGSGHNKRKKWEIFKSDKSLLEGIRVHFLVDDYVHRTYMAEKIKKFNKWDIGLVHFLTEIAMDKVLVKRHKKVKESYDKIVIGIDLRYYGEKLERIFPRSEHKGSVILKDGLEMLSVRNFASWWKINQMRKLVEKYNPFEKINPGLFSLFYLFKLIERDVKKELDSFLEECVKTLKNY